MGVSDSQHEGFLYLKPKSKIRVFFLEMLTFDSCTIGLNRLTEHTLYYQIHNKKGHVYIYNQNQRYRFFVKS